MSYAGSHRPSASISPSVLLSVTLRAAKMRVAAILGLGTSMREVDAFRSPAIEIVMGLPAARGDLEAILIFGGDGTVHRHLRALVELQLPVLLVPAGSGNDFARALGLFRKRDSLPAWASFAVDRGNVRAVDLGIITSMETGSALDGRGRPSLHRQAEAGKMTYFSCAAGVGLDGEIARRANALPRWLRAHGGYALSLPAALLHFRPFQLTLKAVTNNSAGQSSSETRRSVTAAIFANAPFYGGGMKIAPRANMADGALDTCIIRDISRLKLASVFPSVYFGRHLGIREVEYFPIERARVETQTPLDVYADGEYVCHTPVEIGVARSCLRVIVPEFKKSGS